MKVDHNDRRTRSVPVVTDWMTVDRRRQPFGFCGGERAGERLVAGRAGFRVLKGELLEPVGGFQPVSEALRRVRFAGFEDVRVVLRVGREAVIDDAAV